MWTIIIVALSTNGYATTTLHDFSSQAQCETAAAAVVAQNQKLGVPNFKYSVTCVQQ